MKKTEISFGKFQPRRRSNSYPLLILFSKSYSHYWRQVNGPDSKRFRFTWKIVIQGYRPEIVTVKTIKKAKHDRLIWPIERTNLLYVIIC